MESEMIEVTDQEFESEVLKSGLPTLVDFWAAWCGPCKMIAPVVEEIAGEFDGRLKVVKMNVDDNPATPSSLGVMGIPTLILFANGEEVQRLVGFRSKEALVDEIEPYVASG
jgi:thioredoxin 1